MIEIRCVYAQGKQRICFEAQQAALKISGSEPKLFAAIWDGLLLPIEFSSVFQILDVDRLDKG
jgi:hypothetical protein